MTSEAFRVDLRGIVEILSHHLYSSPQVYLRELVQNARDAVVARRLHDPNAPEGTIRVVVDDAGTTVRVIDDGIGLTEDEMRSVLATIGASSKRNDYAETRRQFLGQFGIGLLSAFLVADHIEVVSRSARSADATTLQWVGSSEGTFTIGPAPAPLDHVGTEVIVRARPDDREWLAPRRVSMLLSKFASLLDIPLMLHVGAAAPVMISRQPAPWAIDAAWATTWCRRELGFEPIAALPLGVPAAGIAGVAYIVDSPGRVGSRGGDTVYSRGMFVASDNSQLAPEWAYFVRLAIEAGELPLTASRESLQQGALSDEIAEIIGTQIRSGIERLSDTDPAAFGRFMDVHSRGLLAMAVTDDELLDLVIRHVPWETNLGTMTMQAAARRYDEVTYAATEADFASFGPLLRERRRLLINASYVYGTEIMSALRDRRDLAYSPRRFSLEEFLRDLKEPSRGDAVAGWVSAVAAPVLKAQDVEVAARDFDPDTVPAIYVARSGGARADEPEDGDPWGSMLASQAPAAWRDRLFLNVRSATVRSLVDLQDGHVRDGALTSLCLIAKVSAGHALLPRDTAALSDAMRALIRAAAGTD